ncbi:hypothetical protein ACVBEJ_09090 [Porticoccus sp. GXU_MW_L64]
MNGLMMEDHLTITAIMRFADRVVYGDSEIVSVATNSVHQGNRV